MRTISSVPCAQWEAQPHSQAVAFAKKTKTPEGPNPLTNVTGKIGNAVCAQQHVQTLQHRPPVPMRDPAPGGGIWYDPVSGRNVRQPGFCGDSVGVFHRDSPFHAIPKMRNNLTTRQIGTLTSNHRSLTRPCETTRPFER